MNIPLNREHIEAAQFEQDQKRQEIVATWPQEVQEKMVRLEAAIKEIDDLDMPFSLLVAPFGWKFEAQNKQSFWWYGKLWSKTKDFKEAKTDIDNAKTELVQCSQDIFSRYCGMPARIVFFSKEYPPFFIASGKYYSIFPPKSQNE